jgi:hypothetical protein
MTYRAGRFRFEDPGCSNTFLLLQPLSLPCLFSLSLVCPFQHPSDGRFLGGFTTVGPDTVLPQARLTRIHLWIRLATTASLVAVETCGQVGVHEGSFRGVKG